MLAVVDTNVWISALVKVDGASAQLIDHIGPGGFQPVACPFTLKELRGVSSRKKFAGQYPSIPAMLERIAHGISEYGFNIADPPIVPICRDPKDDVFIALAIASGAPYLVTGDKDLRHPNVVAYLRNQGTEVLTVREFLHLLEQKGEPAPAPS